MKLNKFLTYRLLVIEVFVVFIFVSQYIKTVINYRLVHCSAIVVFLKFLI